MLCYELPIGLNRKQALVTSQKVEDCKPLENCALQGPANTNRVNILDKQPSTHGSFMLEQQKEPVGSAIYQAPYLYGSSR